MDHSVAALRGRARLDMHHRRADMGCVVAQDGGARHVLDPCSRSRAGGGGDRRPELRVSRAQDDFRGNGGREGTLGPLLEILLRSSRCLGVHLGHADDDHVGALRQLVAQRLRTGRQDHQPAAHDPGVGNDRHPDRRNAHDLERAESRDRRTISGCTA